MTESRSLASYAADVLGFEVVDARPLVGGDLSDVLLLELADGRSVVAKSGPYPLREAEMLRALSAARANAPDPIASSDKVLVLEYLGRAVGERPESWSGLGEMLRKLHKQTAMDFGWDTDFAFGNIEIKNARSQDWPSFWINQRLVHQVGLLPKDIARRIEVLCARVPDLIPARPPASLLHGDLWRGNVHFTGDGRAWLIDPACYHGHAEVDLAMLTLFGSPPTEFWDAYGPLEAGWQARRTIYQLWPAIVHLRLFGSGYRPMLDRLLADLGV